MKQTNKAKMFTLLGALVLLGAAAGATAGSAVDKEMNTSLSGDTSQAATSVDEEVQIDEELAGVAHAELFAGAQLDVELQHELIETLELSYALEEEADLLKDHATELPAEQRVDVEAEAEELLEQSVELRMLVEAQLDALDAGSADLLAALETGDEQMIEGALEDEIELVGEIEAEIEVAGTMTDEILMEAESLHAALEAESMAHVDTAEVAELEAAAEGVGEAAADVQAQIEPTLDSHVDAVRDLVGTLGLYVDLDVWLDADLNGAVSGSVGGLLGEEDDDGDESEEPDGSSDEQSQDPESPSGEEDGGSDGSLEEEEESPGTEDSGSDSTHADVCAGPDDVTVDHGSDNSNIVEWTAVAGAEGYRVFRSEAGEEFELVATLEGETRFDDQDVEHDVSYEYRVTAIVDGEETEHCTTLEITAVPVFTTVLAAVGAVGAGVGGYAFMRRRQ